MDHREEAVTQLTTYADLAGRLEHQLLLPTLNEDQVIDGCRMLRSPGGCGYGGEDFRKLASENWICCGLSAWVVQHCD